MKHGYILVTPTFYSYPKDSEGNLTPVNKLPVNIRAIGFVSEPEMWSSNAAKSIIKFIDGGHIEVKETRDEINRMITEAVTPPRFKKWIQKLIFQKP